MIQQLWGSHILQVMLYPTGTTSAKLQYNGTIARLTLTVG